MNNFLDLTLRGAVPDVRSEGGKNLSWHWRGEGILDLVPHTGYKRAIVLSAGIHGNETAPVELLAAIVDDLLAGRLALATRLLVLYGHPRRTTLPDSRSQPPVLQPSSSLSWWGRVGTRPGAGAGRDRLLYPGQ